MTTLDTGLTPARPARLWRAMRERARLRRDLSRLHDLSDRDLLDMGLERSRLEDLLRRGVPR